MRYQVYKRTAVTHKTRAALLQHEFCVSAHENLRDFCVHKTYFDDYEGNVFQHQLHVYTCFTLEGRNPLADKSFEG